MPTVGINWDNAWSPTSLSSTSITTGSSNQTGAISNDGKASTEVSVTVTYGATVTVGAKVYLCRDIDGTNYEGATDGGLMLELPRAASGTYRRSFTVPADKVSAFKILVVNNTGASITVTVNYKQAIVEQTA